MTIRINPILRISVLALIGLTSCIKGELPNIEADIVSVTSARGNLLNVVMQQGNIEAYAVPGTDLTDLTLDIAVSEGATISPAPEEVTDYSAPRTFRVLSEDKQWENIYTVTVRQSTIPTKYDFENWLQPDKMRYRIPYEVQESVNMMIWACGNQAYSFLLGKDDDYTAFPTFPTDMAYSGHYAAKLVTRLTGQIDKPIAAGNLYIGQFDGSRYDPKESTMFGLPFNGHPLRFRGVYNYTSGGKTHKGGIDDTCRIQAVLYRTDIGYRHLNGYTIQGCECIVARAELRNGCETSGYEPFDIEFKYLQPFDPALMSAGQYNLAVVFSSSSNGDDYDGAVGSILLIDNIEIICQD